jgi:hypothetical protein
MSTALSQSQSAAPVAPVVPYEDRMSADWEWGMNQSSLFFEGKGLVRRTVRRISQRLNQLGIPYAVAGGLALFHHGHRRYTENLDLLVTREGMQEIHARLIGNGFVLASALSRSLRDAETGVKIQFLLTGLFPGDGRPRAVAFPHPGEVAEVSDEVRYLNLPTFVTLKLAAGMASANRQKDLADVVELVKSARLGRELAEKLAPSVQAEYEEIVLRVQAALPRFILPSETVTQDRLNTMLGDDGIICEADGRLVTADPVVAQRYNMWPEDEIFE